MARKVSKHQTDRPADRMAAGMLIAWIVAALLQLNLPDTLFGDGQGVADAGPGTGGEIPKDASTQKQARDEQKSTDEVKPSKATPVLVIVIGAPGNETYDKQFAATANRWREIGQKASATVHIVGQHDEPAKSDSTNQDAEAKSSDNTRSKRNDAVNMKADIREADRDVLKRGLASLDVAGEPIWLVLIGHGTFNGAVAKFNLRGPDMAAGELDGWLGRFGRPIVVINGASSSGPFINALSGPGRAIVTATKSGYEINATRFGSHLAKAMSDLRADLDKDGQVSLLEAYLAASRSVAASYEKDGQLATEHALLDDNGDDRGTPAEFFRGVRLKNQAKAGEPDGRRAHQLHLIRSKLEQHMSPTVRMKRNELEQQVEALYARKADLDPAAYDAAMESLMVKLATLYEALEEQMSVMDDPSPEASRKPTNKPVAAEPPALPDAVLK